jgi:hypothetical protein
VQDHQAQGADHDHLREPEAQAEAGLSDCEGDLPERLAPAKGAFPAE